MHNHPDSQQDLVQRLERACRNANFRAPGPGESIVLLLDGTAATGSLLGAMRLLDSAEQARAARFRFRHHRSDYVLAHALWRIALGACLGVDGAEVPLTSTPAGQPMLPGSGLATSLSHSGAWTAIAICYSATIGIDIERSPTHMTLQTLLPSICTPEELARLHDLPDSTREQASLALWTRKEALLKAFGVGLTEDPTTLSTIADGPVPAPASAAHQPPCCVRNLDLSTGLVGALATPVTVGVNRIYQLTLG
jgi:4'-phosphopantetheinyl transferase